MAVSCLLARLCSVIAVASGTSVVRRAFVDSNGGVSTRVKSKQGQSFWHALRQELEAKKKGLASGGANESVSMSADARREILWHAVHEADNEFYHDYGCKIEEGIAYAKEPSALQYQAIYSKVNIPSSRECALMCAADPLVQRSSHGSPCKSFAYNKTAQECKFFSFVHQQHGALAKDACCTFGPPCNLDSMQGRIQKFFEVEMSRAMSLQRQLANQLQRTGKRPAADHSRNTEPLSNELHNVGQHGSSSLQQNHLQNGSSKTKLLGERSEPAVQHPIGRLWFWHARQNNSEESKPPAAKPLSDHIVDGRAPQQAVQQRWIFAFCGVVAIFLAYLCFGVVSIIRHVSSKPVTNTELHNVRFTMAEQVSGY